MRNIFLVILCVVFSVLAGDATIIRQSNRVSVAIDSVNNAIENIENSNPRLFCVFRIAGQELYANNFHEFKVLRALVRLDGALKQSVATGVIDKEIYESMTVAMIESFNTQRPLK